MGIEEDSFDGLIRQVAAPLSMTCDKVERDNKLTDSAKVEVLSKPKTYSKTSRTKTPFLQSDTNPLPVKTKLSDESIAKILRNLNKVHKTFSCVSQTNGINEGTTEAKKDNKRKPPLLELSKENVFEKVKKNRSWDHVGKVCSKTTLAKRVSDVLQQVQQQKQLSDLDLLRGKSKAPRDKKVPLSDFFKGSSSNKSTSPEYPKPRNCPGGQGTPEKSMSFDSLKLLSRSKQPCKCLSLENDQSRVPAHLPLGVFNVHKKSFIPAESSNSKPMLAESSFWHGTGKPWEKTINITQEILSGRNRSFKAAGSGSATKIHEFQHKASFLPTSVELGRYQKYRSNQNEEMAYENCDLESLLANGRLAIYSDPAKKYSEQTWQETEQQKETVQICQCLHFHTEEGFKKLALHNNPTKEYGSKFFRVNYYPREKDEDVEDMDNRIELVDKETTTENESESEELKKLKHIYSILEEKGKVPLEKEISARLKTISKSSVKTIGKNQGNTKKKELKGDSTTQFVLWRNSKRDIGQPKKEENISSQKGIKDTKTKKGMEVKERKKLGQPLKKSELVSNEEIKQKRALEELDALEKLFTKLNSVENSLKKHKVSSQEKAIRKCPEEKSEASEKKANATALTLLTDPKFFADNEAEEDYQRRRRKLRSAIIRHVQNWLKLDFSDL